MRRRPPYALFGEGEGFKCLGTARSPQREVAWDMATVAGAAWGGLVGARYGKPALGAFLGASLPTLAHWLSSGWEK